MSANIQKRKENTKPSTLSIVSESSLEKTASAEMSTLGVRLFDVLIVLLIGLFMCLYDTGKGSFASGDQTTHARVVQHMYYTGDWLHPFYDGRPYYNKPPFKMWLSLIPLHFLGETNFSYRVIDGLAGAGITLTVFLFARALFASRTIAYCSVLSLLGCSVFYFGHGVRNAVQDGMMLFLMNIGLIIGWYFTEKVRTLPVILSRTQFWNLFRYAVAGGVFIGLAALTKNVAGYFALIILGVYAICSGQAWSLLKRVPLQLFTVLGLSLSFPAAYILSQGEDKKAAFELLVVTEVYKRATTINHFPHSKLYYWNAIVQDRLALPPEVILPCLLIGLYFCFRNKDRRYLLLVCWSIIPVLVQSLMVSKMFWYMLPAIPGMALLSGAVVGSALLTAWNSFRNKLAFQKRFSNLGRASILFAGISLGSLTYNAYSIVNFTFITPWKRNPTDEFVSSVREYEVASGRRLKTLFYDLPILARHEPFYFNMLDSETLPEDAPFEEARKKVESGNFQFVISRITDFAELAKIRPFYSYRFLPFRGFRRKWLSIINYDPSVLPQGFIPVETQLVVHSARDILGYGFGNPQKLAHWVFLPSSGKESAFILDGGLPYEEFGTEVSANIASAYPSAEGKIDVDVFMNGMLVAELKQVSEGFHQRSFAIPNKIWQSGKNQLRFRYKLPDASEVKDDQSLLFFESFKFKLGSGRAAGALSTPSKGSEESLLTADDKNQDGSEEDEGN